MLEQNKKYPDNKKDSAAKQNKVSANLFQGFLEQAQDGIAIIDSRENILEWNAGWEQISGIGAREAIGLHFTQVMPNLFKEPEWQDTADDSTLHSQVMRSLELISSSGLPRLVEGQLRPNDGTRKWIQALTFPIHAEETLLFGIIARDVSSLKLTEERLQRYTHQLETLRQSGLEISAELGLDSLVWMIGPRAIELLNGAAMALYLHDPEKNILELAISLGDNQPELAKRVQRGDGLAGRVWETNQAALIEDFHTGHTGKLNISHWGKVASAPIGWGNEFLGVVFVFSDQNFFESDLKILELFSSHVAAAIHNALLHKKLGLLAVTDSLTGVYNRRHFFEMAEKEFSQARRYKRQFSLIMFDLDLFKKVNDTYGHTLGDEVLRMVVQRCAALMRDADILGRYGGEEFVIALPETGATDALALAERLRLALASSPVESQTASALITASFGIATLTPEINKLGTILNRADAALYHAKKAGRNQVRAWEPGFDDEITLSEM